MPYRLLILATLTIFSIGCDGRYTPEGAQICPAYPAMPEGAKSWIRSSLGVVDSPEFRAWLAAQVALKEKLLICRGE